MTLSFKEIKEVKNKYKNTNTKINLKHTSKLSKCEWCGGFFTPKHHRQKYCSTECYANHRREYKADWKRENYEPKKKRLGTGGIDGKPNDDFEKELRIIRNEKRRLKI